MASKSLTIWNKLIEIIANMRSEDGYHNTIIEASKKFYDITKLSSFPCVSVLEGGESKEVINEDESLYRPTRTYYVIGFGSTESDNDDEGIVGEAADMLGEDLQEVLLRNINDLDYPSTEADSLVIVSVDPMPIENTNKYFVGIEIRVRYTHDVDV